MKLNTDCVLCASVFHCLCPFPFLFTQNELFVLDSYLSIAFVSSRHFNFGRKWHLPLNHFQISTNNQQNAHSDCLKNLNEFLYEICPDANDKCA